MSQSPAPPFSSCSVTAPGAGANAVHLGADGNKHLTVVSGMDSAAVRALHQQYVMPATFHYYAVAKGVASGLPLGITTATPEIAASFKGLTLSTYGGNPISSVAALATLHVMSREEIPARAERLGGRLRAGLTALQDKHQLIGEVRGMGLMQGVELVEDRKTKEPASRRTNLLVEALRRRRLLIGKGGLYGNTLRIAPPMLVQESQIDEALSHLDSALTEVASAQI